MLPATGSIITQAMPSDSSQRVFSRVSGSLYGMEIVFLTISSGTPGLPGIPRVMTPDPALTRKESAWP